MGECFQILHGMVTMIIIIILTNINHNDPTLIEPVCQIGLSMKDCSIK